MSNEKTHFSKNDSIKRHDRHLTAEVIGASYVCRNKDTVVSKPLRLPAVTPKDKAAFELRLSVSRQINPPTKRVGHI